MVRGGGAGGTSISRCVQLGHPSSIRLRLGIDFPFRNEKRPGRAIFRWGLREVTAGLGLGRRCQFLANVCSFSEGVCGVARGRPGT